MKTFEDYFSELQADMVSVCLDYLKKCGVEISAANNIYIHCSYERSRTCNFFFRISGKMVQRHKVSDTARDREKGYQGKALDSLIENLYELGDICKQHEKPMPTEIRLVYDIQENRLEAAYKYDPIVDTDKEKLAADFAEEWFEQLAKKFDKE